MNDFRLNLPKRLYTAQQVRDLDRCAIEQFHIPSMTLMERAGASCFRLIARQWPQAQSMLVLCGAGNNAGDGYVIASLADQAGWQVEIIQLGALARLKGDAARCAERALQAELTVVEVQASTHLLAQRRRFDHSDVIVDALLGTGLKGPVRPLYDKAIELINDACAGVFAVDLPSGLCADSGAELGRAVNAQLTNTFIGVKRGLLTGRGPAKSGHVLFDDLGVPEAAYQQSNDASEIGTVERIDWPVLKTLLRPREQDSHKGCFGHVLVVGGNYAMAGAVAMAGEAALRVGAGRVSIATRPEHVAIVTAIRPEIMVHGIDSVAQLEPLINSATILVVGPGLGQDLWAQQLFAALIGSSKPLVIDADGLNLLALAVSTAGPTTDATDEQGLLGADSIERDVMGEPLGIDKSTPENPARDKKTWVLTPHPGEAGRLLAVKNAVIGQDRFRAAMKLQAMYQATVVLKGAGTLIAGAQYLRLASVGNPGMASAGMGDVLSGIIGGLLAQGLNEQDAAALGVVLHGAAADRSAAESGERGLLATDLFDHLRHLINP